MGDYTWRLAEELSGAHDTFILTSAGQTPLPMRARVIADVPGWGVRGMFTLWRHVAALQPTWVAIEFVPFLYARRGINFAVPAFALWLRARGFRVFLQVHEPFVALDTPKHMVLGVLQRAMLCLLLAASRKVAVTTLVWCDMLRRLIPWRRDDVFWLPSGSNVPRVDVSDRERQALRGKLGLGDDDVLLAVISPFGAGKLPELVWRAWKRAASRTGCTRLLVIGVERDQALRLDRSAPGGDRVVYAGYVNVEEVSRLLTCADVFVCPYVDGVSARRTSVISAMEHGLPVVTTRGHLTDPGVFDASPLVLTDVGDGEGFCAEVEALATVPARRRAVGEATRAFFEERFAWPHLGGTILRELAC
ncbi:MAG: glycosyltransferase family 4 protein [Chloroflexi bacterium]|nr:glycosyltransferase family 4 protein [Chloroflexota bacterium]